jgi:NAD(P)-dependent dehydrogenase (short-subunit alcohol dehydrogenase family)
VGKLEGKISLITGANSGIGLATAKRFVNEGAYVFMTGRRDVSWPRRSSGSARTWRV